MIYKDCQYVITFPLKSNNKRAKLRFFLYVRKKYFEPDFNYKTYKMDFNI